MTRASRAGVRPRESRTSSARGTSTSTSIRAISASSSAAASRGDVEVEPVAHDEVVERVPVLRAAAVELDDAAVLDRRATAPGRSARSSRRARARRAARSAPRGAARAARARRSARIARQPARSPRSAYTCAASRTNAAVGRRVQLSSSRRPRFELRRRRAPRTKRRVDREDRLVGERRQLGRAEQVVGELRAARVARDLRLQAQRLRRRAELGGGHPLAVQLELVERDPARRADEIGPARSERIVAARIEGSRDETV